MDAGLESESRNEWFNGTLSLPDEIGFANNEVSDIFSVDA